MNTTTIFAAIALFAAPAAYASAAPTKGTPLKPTKPSLPYAAPAVTLRAYTDAKSYAPGQPIKITLVAQNTSKKAATLNFTSGQRFDFRVFPRGSRESAYTWSANKMFMQMLGSVTLRPGQKQSFNAQIGDEEGFLKPGRYSLDARLSNTGRAIVAPSLFFEVKGVGIALKARTDKAAYKVGEPVKIDAVATNTLGRANTLDFFSGMACDFIIADESGNSIWTYGANLRFVRALGKQTWAAGEAKDYGATWNGTPFPSEDGSGLKPGRYQVRAVLQTQPSLSSEPVWIDITS